jgi:anthranilate synthase component I
MTPDRDACQALADQGHNLIPVVRRLVADELTPVGVLARIQDEPYAFLFESVVGGERLARYSMLGFQPRERLVGDLKQVAVQRPDGAKLALLGDPYQAVRSYLALLKSPKLPDLPRFCGGLVGYLSYDTVRMLEPLPHCPPDALGLPDLHLMRFDTVLVFDHSYNHLLLITHLDLKRDGTVAKAWARAEAELDALERRLEQPLAASLVEATAGTDPVYRQHTSQAKYEQSVRAIHEYILAGDAFQVVLSQRLSAPCSVTPFQVYRSLRSLNPSPYLFYLRLGDAAMVGA